MAKKRHTGEGTEQPTRVLGLWGWGAGSWKFHKGQRPLDWVLREENCEEERRKGLTARGRVA